MLRAWFQTSQHVAYLAGVNGHREDLNDPERLASLGRAQLLDSPPDEAFDRLTRLASQILDAPIALVSLVDDRRQFFKSLIGLGDPWATARETPLSHSYCQYVVGSGQPLIISDARKHPLLRDSPAIQDLGAISYCGVPVVDLNNRVLGTLCVLDDQPREWSDEQIEALQDIARSVIAEVHLRLLAADLHDANASLKEFVAIASHDLRNPLGVILMNAQLLVDPSDPISEKERVDSTQDILHAAERANRLVEELLDLSKLEADAVEPVRVSVDLAAVADRILRHPDLSEVDAIVPAEARVFADPDHVERILVNLISNAIKYGEFPISLTAKRRESGVEVVVSDTGKGVPADFLPRLFQTFARSDASRASDRRGTGLGLAIVKRLVEVNDGTIRYERGDSGGARFVVQLPLAPPDSGDLSD